MLMKFDVHLLRQSGATKMNVSERVCFLNNLGYHNNVLKCGHYH